MKTITRKGKIYVPYLHLFVLAGFSVAQPVFDLLSRNPEFLVAHHAQPVEILLLVFLLSVLIPLLAVGLELLAWFVDPLAQRVLHVLLIGFFSFLFALHTLRSAKLDAVALVGIAMGMGALFSWLYQRCQPLHALLTILTPSVILFPYLFLFDAQIGTLLPPPPVESASIVSTESKAPVVMVVFDELPTISLLDEGGSIDPIRYPNLYELVQDSYWFRNASTINTGTLVSVPAILDGLYPRGSHLPNLKGHPHNLFTLLAASHRLYAFENITELAPQSGPQSKLTARMRMLIRDTSIVYLHLLLPPDLASRHLPRLTESWKDFSRLDRRPEEKTAWKEFRADWSGRALKFQEFVDSIDSTPDPGFYFFHSMLPHGSWTHLPSGKRYTLSKKRGIPGIIGPNNQGIDVTGWSDNEWLVIQAYQRHLLQVGFVDRLVGNLVTRLKEVGLYNDALIVITSDHGTSFIPKDSRREITPTNHPDIMLVPLIIKTPKQEQSVVSDRNVEIIDILPTIAHLLDIDLPWPVDGHSALDVSQPERKAKIITGRRGRRLTVDPHVKAQVASLKRKHRLFGSGPIERLFKVGPWPELVGQSLNEVKITGSTSLRVELDGTSFLQDVNLDSPFLLAHITGRIRNSTVSSEPLVLAVSVNDIIQAVTRTAQIRGTVEFSAVVPETSFRNGKNDVSIHLITGTRRGATLTTLQRYSGLRFELASRKSGDELRLSDGRIIPVGSDGVTGWVVSSLNRREERVKIGGWAADLKDFSLPESVVLFKNRQFLRARRTDLEKKSVVDRFGRTEILQSGFLFELSLGVFEKIESAEIRLFAVSKRGLAGELNYPPPEKSNRWHFRPNPSRPHDPVTKERLTREESQATR